MDLYDAIARRRDTRAEFTGRPPSDAALNRVLEAANQAPSVGMSQPWVFVTVRDPAGLQDFRGHVAAQREVFASSLADDPERAGTFSRIKVEGITESGLGVVVGHDPTAARSSCTRSRTRRSLSTDSRRRYLVLSAPALRRWQAGECFGHD